MIYFVDILLWGGFLILLGVVGYKQYKARKREDFEKRDN